MRCMLACGLSLLLLATASSPALGQDEAPLFPFTISYDAPDNVTNASSWLHAPAGKHGFVRVENGHLATDAGRFQIWGVNLCFGACFPEKSDADELAARLARFGINAVRLHHMDSRDIWGDSGNHTDIDPKQLDKLDYLIAQFKKHGVYVNINLHVSRTLDDRDGFVNKDGRPKYDKGLDNLDPRMIEMQKKYARDLLTHVNPYTNTAYTDEPAVAIVEINNENGLMLGWANRDLDDLPEPYATEYRRQWNAWLTKKYGTTDALRTAWGAGAKPLRDDVLADGRFQGERTGGQLGKHWSVQRDAACDVDSTIVDGQGGKLLRVVVRKTGEVSWVPQVMYNGVSLEEGEPYTLSYRIRADKADKLTNNVRQLHDPWGVCGLNRSVDVGPEWKTYEFTFLATQTEDGGARVDWSGLDVNTYEIADLALRPGGVYGLAEDATLEAGTVPVVERGNLNVTEAAKRDFVDFLWEAERDYWAGMDRFLKEELGVKSIVAGTQVTWSPTHVQAMLDFCDAHAYWNHPTFPNRPWDGNDWYLRNIALVDNVGKGTLTRLADTRVAGKPFTISEYNHPDPNDFAAEGFPMLACFGRFQDWDGVFLFTYSHSTNWRQRRLDSYFNVESNTPRMAHMIACSAAFLRGDVEPAKKTILVGMDEETEREILYREMTPRSLRFSNLDADARLALEHAVAVDLDGTTSPEAADEPEWGDVIQSDTKQLFYRTPGEAPEQGAFVAKTPNTVAVSGFGERSYDLTDVGLALRIGPTRLNWATVSITSLEGDGLTSPGRKLLAATGVADNTNEKRESLGGDRITMLRNWGEAPTLCEGIPLEVMLDAAADRVSVFALDERGERMSEIEVGKGPGGRAKFSTSPNDKTVWYEIEVR